MTSVRWQILFFGVALNCPAPVLEALHAARPIQGKPIDKLDRVFRRHGMQLGDSHYTDTLTVRFPILPRSPIEFDIYRGVRHRGTFQYEWAEGTHMLFSILRDRKQFCTEANWFAAIEDILKGF